MKKYRLLTLLALVCFMFTLVGCDNPTGIIPPVGNNSNTNGDNDNDKDNRKPDNSSVFTVYRADNDLQYLIAENITLDNVKKEDRFKEVLQALASGKPKIDKVQNIFPENTKVINVKVKDGLAEANFSKELLLRHIGGSSYELLLVGSIVNTLTEFPEIKQVQILVDGERIETINGHMDLVDPLKRNEDLIKKVVKDDKK